MGMRRLSVIDVEGGRQPISNEDGTVWVVFNGEIYNHHELRKNLESAGHCFRTHCDTEVLVHLYEQYGTDMAVRLHGMFAFSIWDTNKQLLFMARDRAGMKPLSYLATADGLAYFSELRSLLAYSASPPTVSSSSVLKFLMLGYVPDPDSIFEGVRKLRPGHSLTWTAAKGIQIERFWSPEAPQENVVGVPELVDELRHKLDKAVKSHLESEVPLGAFLSGGLDSSTVVALMSRHASGRVKTFSIGFAEAEFDESATARTVAKYFETEHTEMIVRPDIEPMFETIAAMFDEPFADPSAIPTFLVSQLARQSVTVALSGDGGDELFGGYTRYGDSLRQLRLPAPLRAVATQVGRRLPHAFPGRNRIVDMGRSEFGRYLSRTAQSSRIDEGGIASRELGESSQSLEWLLQGLSPEELPGDFATGMMDFDFQTYLPGDILTKVDRTSMSVSLEARAPLLDVELVSFAQRLPSQLRVTPGESKRILRLAIRGLVPDSVLNLPKKGFAVPLGAWFRGPLRHRVESLRTPSDNILQYIDQGAVSRIIREHLNGRRDHSSAIWRLMVLDRWLEALKAGALSRPPAVPTVNLT